MYEKFKALLADDTVFICLLILLVGIVSFGLGRESVVQNQISAAKVPSKPPVVTQLPSIELPETRSSVQDTTVVASKSGTKYHLLDCPGAKQIKPDNKLEFTSIVAAEAAGYSPAANCPGLQ